MDGWVKGMSWEDRGSRDLLEGCKVCVRDANILTTVFNYPEHA